MNTPDRRSLHSVARGDIDDDDIPRIVCSVEQLGCFRRVFNSQIGIGII
jgi:hypothetical protein